MTSRPQAPESPEGSHSTNQESIVSPSAVSGGGLTREEAKALLATHRRDHAELYGMLAAWDSGTEKLRALASGGGEREDDEGYEQPPAAGACNDEGER